MSRLYNKSYPSVFQAESTTVKSVSFRRKSASRVIIKQPITEKKGTILIVDISGYTHFVKQADHAAGAQVISSLLSSIIKNNTLGFHISEIEGDAILFYKYGIAQPVAAMLSQFEQMLAAFYEQIDQWKLICPHVAMLSIKMVTHYGAIVEFKVDRFGRSMGRRLSNHTAF